MVLEQLDHHIKYKELQLKVHTILKNQVKNIQNINVKPKTLKLLEHNIEEHFCVLGLNKDFLDIALQV